jgi:dephospho-CoA kinase
MTLHIGLVGPIGCGKSTVAGWLAQRGGVVIDADQLAREVTLPGTPGLAAVAQRFGPAVLDGDGVLDRAALARIVFADPDALRDLETIVHPAVGVLLRSRIAEAASAGVPFVVVEAIKLVESGLAALCDEVWLIECASRTQRDRLAERGMDAGDVERRIAAQGVDLAARLAAHVSRRISTDGTGTDVREGVLRALDDALEDALAHTRRA